MSAFGFLTGGERLGVAPMRGAKVSPERPDLARSELERPDMAGGFCSAETGSRETMSV